MANLDENFDPNMDIEEIGKWFRRIESPVIRYFFTMLAGAVAEELTRKPTLLNNGNVSRSGANRK